MSIKKISLKVTALLSLFVLLASSQIFAKECCKPNHDRHHGCEVIAAQANYQDENPFIPVVDQPIAFSERNFRTHVDVNNENTVFEVRIPGLYSIDAFLLLNVPNIGDRVGGYITINGRKLLTFFNSETRTSSPIVDFHFNDRLVYLREGDQVSVVLSGFTEGTTVLARGFVLIALNNSH